MGIRSWRCSTRHVMAVVLFTAMVLVEQAVTCGAVSPTPPNPSDDEREAGQDRVDALADLVSQLTDQVAEADAALLVFQSELALKREETNKALIDLEVARAAAVAARTAADTARAEADAATARVAEARRRTDQFAAASFRQGSTLVSLSAFLSSRSPKDLLARLELLDAMGSTQRDALEHLRRAHAHAAGKDARAHQTLVLLDAAEQVKADAQEAADSAYRAALAAESEQAARSAALRGRESDLARELAEAQHAAIGPIEARNRHGERAIQRGSSHMSVAAESSSGGLIQDVINRAMAQRGVHYSWGGGDANGPTTGIRDASVADTYGDYRTMGFDCSGLMIYAFAAALGYSLPHYSGAQYDAGRRVPLENKRPGDMLFWGSSGRIHHVALYLGNEQMIEAPYSGSAVRVTAVRYAGIMPYVTRIL